MRQLSVPAGIMALATIIPGGFSLLLDLGQPLRAIHLFLSFTSVQMSWGSYILLIYSIIAVAYVWLAWRNDSWQEGLGQGGCHYAACAGHVYGGIDCCRARASVMEFAVIPVLFFVSWDLLQH